MNWRVKATIQKALGFLPGGGVVHYQLQRRLGGLRDCAAECRERLDEACLMIQRLERAGVPLAGASMLEMGAGYYPAFPLSMYLGGARHVLSVDLNRHQRADLTRECAGVLASDAGPLMSVSSLDHAEFTRRLRRAVAALREGDDLASATEGCVSYRAPYDARRTELAPGSVDVVFSNNVLEHVPRPELEDCFEEAHRILRPGGVAIHQVDCGDHYADVDGLISKYNYLRFEAEQWSRWDNAFLYQNRLRASDFRRIAESAGFEVEMDAVPPTELELEQLDEIDLASCFRGYGRHDLVTTAFAVIARRPGSP